jgi:hypothetical protein
MLGRSVFNLDLALAVLFWLLHPPIEKQLIADKPTAAVPIVADFIN